MPQRLTDLAVEEVSLVDDPANPEAHVLLFKRREPKDGDKGFRSSLKALLQKFGYDVGGSNGGPRTYDEVEEASEENVKAGNLWTSLSEIINSDLDADQKAQLMRQSVDEFFSDVDDGSGSNEEDTTMSKKAPQLPKLPDISKMTDVQKAKTLEDHAVALTKYETDLAAFNKAQEDETAAEAARKAKEAAEAANDPANKGKKKGSDEDPTDDEDKENMEKSVAKAVEAAVAKALEPLTKENKELKDQVNKMTESAEKSARVAKAKEITKGLTGVDADKIADMLKGMTDEQTKELETTLKAASAQVAKAQELLLRENGHGLGKSGNAFTTATAKAAELRKSNPKLSEQQAMAKVWRDNPELYAQHEQERKN